MNIRILVTAPYGQMDAIVFNEGDVVAADDFGDLAYINTCVDSGLVEIVNEQDVNDKNGEDESSELDNIQILASPTAAKLAQENGVDLFDVGGTGKSGKITVTDVRDYMAKTANLASGNFD